MVVAFTGTQDGTTREQHWALDSWLFSNAPQIKALLHGDCIGADAEAAEIGRAHGLRLVAHPTNIKGKRANAPADETMPVKSPLERNQQMVDLASVVVACPKQREEQLRSGTWATIRYARKMGRRLVICWPDGLVSTEGWNEND